jgi:hypothetical protein
MVCLVVHLDITLEVVEEEIITLLVDLQELAEKVVVEMDN